MFNKKHGSKFTLGTAQLGMNYGIANRQGQPDIDLAISIVQEAVAQGVKSIDTARAYGNAEVIIGEALKNGALADQVNIITKLEPLANLEISASDKDIRLAVDNSIYKSCKNLQTHQLETLLLHRWEHLFTYDEAIWRRLLELQEEGIIKSLGVSVYTPREAIEAFKKTSIKHIQIPFNLLDWRWRSPEFQQSLSQRKDVVVHTRSTLLQGLLTANLEIWQKIIDSQPSYWNEILDQFVKQFNRESKVDLCFAYVRSKSWVNSLVVGLETKEQLQENLRLFQLPPLTPEESQKLETELRTFPEELLNPSTWKLK